MSDSSSPRIGERFAGTYKLTALLRGAGAAQVFAAVDPGGREVALVTVDPARCDPNDWASFAGFIAAATAANIPGVSLLRGVGPTPPSPPHCLAEVPTGRAFDRLREGGGPLPWQRALALGEQVAAILEAVETTLGTHHGALTAARCVLAGDHDVKVLDFGLALLEPHGRADDGYRAPEQQLGPGDHRSDIYSLAAILFELIAGTRPSPKLPPRLRSLVPDAPPAVDELLARALARAPEQRHPELARFRAALRELLGLGPVPTLPAPAPAAPRPAAPPPVAVAEPPAAPAQPAPPELPGAANPASPPPSERPRAATPATQPQPERPRAASSPQPEPARASTPAPSPTRPPVAAARPKTPPRGAEPRVAPSSPAAAERPRPAPVSAPTPRPAPSALAPLPALDQLRTLAADDDDPDAALPTMAFGGNAEALPTMAFAGSVGKAAADRTVILPGAPSPATPDRTVIAPGGPAKARQSAAPATPDRTVVLPGAAPARPFAGLADVPVDRTVRFPQSGEAASARPWAPPAGTTVDRAVRQAGITIDRAVRVGGSQPAPADRTVILPGPGADDEPLDGATIVDPRSPRRAASRDDQTLIVPRGAPNNQETMILDLGAAPGTARPPAPVPAPRWPLKKTLIVVNVVAALLLVIVLLSR